MGKDQELLEACRTGNLAAVEKHLQGRLSAKTRGSRASSVGALSTLSKSFWNLKSANINCVDASGDTPLHLAALNGHKEIVSILLDCEASPTILDSQDCSPLHLAAWNGHTDICKQLITASDDLAFVNLQTRDGNTALHFSAQHGHDSTLCLLLQKKADPTIRNLEDLSPLDLAAQYDRLDIVKQLVTSHPELLTQRSAINTPLHLASRNGHRAVVQYLIDTGFPLDARTDKGTALHEAANFCKLDVIRLLLDRGIDITVKSQTGCTAEDILRSIPSKAAEDALNILKTYIYHQRTPDSDGERGIVATSSVDLPSKDYSQATPPPMKALPSVVAPSPAERSTYLHKSLPPGYDAMSTPPPIPPRQSVRVPDQSDSFNEQGLIPLKVPVPPERGSEKELSSDEDKNKLSPGPCDVSPGSRDVSPPARSPTDQPKKPPRKKPLSFRRVEPGPHLPSEPHAGGGNYVNLDPSVEKALLDARSSMELGSTEPSDVITTAPAENPCVNAVHVPSSNFSISSSSSTATDPPGTGQGVTEQAAYPDNETQKLSQELLHISNTDLMASTEEAVVLVAKMDTHLEHADCVGEELRDEVGTKPPSSLDIVQTDEKTDQVLQSPVHQQPPTPDCPPPSPGTAIQNIHCRIHPMEKRRSRDIETITDSTITGQDDLVSPSVVSDGNRLSTEVNQASLTPVNEEPSLVVGGTLPQGQRPKKKKPTPLPRKSSLTSESKDIHPRSPASIADVAGGSTVCSHPSSVWDHDSDQLGRHVHVLISQHQVRSVEFTKEEDSAGSHLVSLGPILSGHNVEDSNSLDATEDAVLLRRSVSAGNEPVDWEGNAFAGLLRGSVLGPARDVVQQLEANSITAAALRKKRKSTLSTFAPVMEEDKDIDPEKLMGEIDGIGARQMSGGKKSDDNVFDDDSEDWAQISATFETFGVGLSRESVFVREHEANFAKFLSQGDSKIQSIGEWLADVGLPQYENTLVANGFDDTDFLGGNILEDQDLLSIGVEDPFHRHLILEGAASLARFKPIDPMNLPVSVEEWLGSLRLDYYYDTFMSHKYDSMDRVIKLWELELVTVLDITSIGHRKRILASLGERPLETNVTRTRVPSLEGLSNPRSPFEHVDLYRDYTGVKSRVSDPGSDSDAGQGSLPELDVSNQTSPIQGRANHDNSIHIRAPHQVHYTGAIKQWRHKPEVLIKGCCNYTAHYLGSTLVKELKGAMSTQEGIAKLKKSSEVINKIPTIVLSISFKGVKFIDAASKKVVCDHEIANIFCACQDGEHMNFFAYITKDREASKHYCHVFSVRSKELAGEIILTLGEAFEIAYQMVLKERADMVADELDKLSASDGDDTTSVSSKASVHTV
ncbi:hypothetical protein BsWGS_07897 [Bradybaena similaris]